MKPVDQTILHDPDPNAEFGNCFQACIASIFELPLDQVPHFCRKENHGEGTWFLELDEWCQKRGYQPVYIETAARGKYIFFGDAYHVVSGPAERGVLHSCVGFGADIVHDPHPSRSGLIELHDFIIFAAINPR